MLADAARPTGPAATDASAPSETLLLSIFVAASRFITSSTRSISLAPAWNPQLPFSSSMNTGELQPLAVRQLITPLPYSPPNDERGFLHIGNDDHTGSLLPQVFRDAIFGAAQCGHDRGGVAQTLLFAGRKRCERGSCNQ